MRNIFNEIISQAAQPTASGFGDFSTPYGKAWVAWTSGGISQLIFAEGCVNDAPPDHKTAEALGHAIFNGIDLPLDLHGTPFQHKVWAALKAIPRGTTTTYAAIADRIKHPNAYRAVGTAVGANPISFIIPCHRVLPKTGQVGNYRWGTSIKQMLLEAEGIICKHQAT